MCDYVFCSELSEQGDVLVLLLYSLLAEENQEGLTFNVVHQRLVYADVVDLLSANASCLHCWLLWKEVQGNRSTWPGLVSSMYVVRSSSKVS